MDGVYAASSRRLKDSMDEYDGNKRSSCCCYSLVGINIVLILLGCAAFVGWNAESFLTDRTSSSRTKKTAVISLVGGESAAEEQILNSRGGGGMATVQIKNPDTLIDYRNIQTEGDKSLWKDKFCTTINKNGGEIGPTSKCKCTDPTIPLARTKSGVWMDHHKNMVSQLLQHNKRHPLDVVMVGDSLVERWNGTQHWGTIVKPTQQKIFQKFFHRINDNPQQANYDKKVYGLAIGSAADTSRNLFWHLKHGLLLTENPPKVWLILIGTNDLAMKQCTKEWTLAGILEVANLIAKTYPNSAILLHGLLPRGGGHNQLHHASNIMTLGGYWQDIQWINSQLQLQLKQHLTNWYYMDTGNLFLSTTRSTVPQLNATLINPQDGLHPSLAGYKAWGPLIVEKVQEILSQQQ